ncbi:hypothetical protein B0H65DRAFT_443001 [Neurospora tetraspora]|uniref:Uncharacterized protein n=1 Tax=Neurospora tetraspora TaxID=94610 RepID=A0AAE0JG37_9PEZI|nr:hypothetical protein B0H65DRAFT_443001 [Neurospora tetraspora]
MPSITTLLAYCALCVRYASKPLRTLHGKAGFPILHYRGSELDLGECRLLPSALNALFSLLVILGKYVEAAAVPQEPRCNRCYEHSSRHRERTIEPSSKTATPERTQPEVGNMKWKEPHYRNFCPARRLKRDSSIANFPSYYGSLCPGAHLPTLLPKPLGFHASVSIFLQHQPPTLSDTSFPPYPGQPFFGQIVMSLPPANCPFLDSRSNCEQQCPIVPTPSARPVTTPSQFAPSRPVYLRQSPMTEVGGAVQVFPASSAAFPNASRRNGPTIF